MVSFFYTFLPLFQLRHRIHALVLGYAGQQAIKRPRVLLVLPLTQQKSYCANSVPELLWKYILYKYLVFWWGRFLIPFFQSKRSIFTRMFHVHTKCRIQHLKTRKDTKEKKYWISALTENFAQLFHQHTSKTGTFRNQYKQIEFSNLHIRIFLSFQAKLQSTWNLRYSKVVKYVH